MTGPPRRFDLIVAGAGPGGAALAALAAGAGLQVALIERARFPRDKVCGEFVSAEGCAVLGQLGVLEPLRGEGAPPIVNCRLTTRRGRPVDSALPRPEGPVAAVGISRARMDQLLLERAGALGALVLQPCKVVEPVVEQERVVGCVIESRPRQRETLRASLVVAADGRRSLFVKTFHPKLGDPLRSDATSWIGLKTHLDACGSAVDGRVDLHLFDRGYAGVTPVEGGRINLCLMTTAGSLRDAGKSPDRLAAEQIARNPGFLEALGGPPRRVAPWQSVGPLRFGARRPSTHGMLFVGDAAGTIDPYCGEGISNALLAARLALPYAIGAARSGALDTTAARAYSSAWLQHFAPVTRRVRRLGRLLERPALADPILVGLSRFGRGITPKLVASTRTARAPQP